MSGVEQKTVWIWRSGIREERDKWAIDNGYAGGGWDFLPSMVDVVSEEGLRALYERVQPGTNPRRQARHLGQLWSIRNLVQAGDVVVMPRNGKGAVAVGVVVSGYEYLQDELDNSRRHAVRVDWQIPEYPRDQLDPETDRALRAQGTIYQPQIPGVAERLIGILDNHLDTASTRPDLRTPSTYILTWNAHDVSPDSAWHTSGRWSTRSRQPKIGDRVFLLRQREHRGIVRAGYVSSEAELGPHWDPSKAAAGSLVPYLGIRWDEPLAPMPPISTETLLRQIPAGNWNSRRNSGSLLAEEPARELEQLWAARSTPAQNDSDPNPRKPEWTWSEEVLLYEVFLRNGALEAASEETILLARDLQQLKIHTFNGQTLSSRSPQAVARRLNQLAAAQPGYSGSDRWFHYLDAAISERLGEDLETVSELAALVRAGRIVDDISADGDITFRTTRTRTSKRKASPAPDIQGGSTQTLTRVRRGQRPLRNHLLSTAGPVCIFTGVAPTEALEAAHLYSYAKIQRHDVRGAALMRADLHKLFDRMAGNDPAPLAAIDPERWLIWIHPDVRRIPAYGSLHLTPARAEWREAIDHSYLMDHYACRRTLD